MRYFVPFIDGVMMGRLLRFQVHGQRSQSYVSEAARDYISKLEALKGRVAYVASIGDVSSLSRASRHAPRVWCPLA